MDLPQFILLGIPAQLPGDDSAALVYSELHTDTLRNDLSANSGLTFEKPMDIEAVCFTRKWTRENGRATAIALVNHQLFNPGPFVLPLITPTADVAPASPNVWTDGSVVGTGTDFRFASFGGWWPGRLLESVTDAESSCSFQYTDNWILNQAGVGIGGILH